mmetsp:Transcript_97839/g.281500  ORF Transcript_97839/g.281500 Transcript_97839/m.281500 type:complete len:216 (-) Transcript_97839:175-822(-)
MDAPEACWKRCFRALTRAFSSACMMPCTLSELHRAMCSRRSCSKCETALSASRSSSKCLSLQASYFVGDALRSGWYPPTSMSRAPLLLLSSAVSLVNHPKTSKYKTARNLIGNIEPLACRCTPITRSAHRNHKPWAANATGTVRRTTASATTGAYIDFAYAEIQAQAGPMHMRAWAVARSRRVSDKSKCNMAMEIASMVTATVNAAHGAPSCKAT